MVIMKSYIFLTTEGYTFQPDSEVSEPDIENCQVIGFSCGITAKEAFDNLTDENNYLLKTSFNEILGIELNNTKRNYFYLDEKKYT